MKNKFCYTLRHNIPSNLKDSVTSIADLATGETVCWKHFFFPTPSLILTERYPIFDFATIKNCSDPIQKLFTIFLRLYFPAEKSPGKKKILNNGKICPYFCQKVLHMSCFFSQSNLVLLESYSPPLHVPNARASKKSCLYFWKSPAALDKERLFLLLPEAFPCRQKICCLLLRGSGYTHKRHLKFIFTFNGCFPFNLHWKRIFFFFCYYNAARAQEMQKWENRLLFVKMRVKCQTKRKD